MAAPGIHRSRFPCQAGVPGPLQPFRTVRRRLVQVELPGFLDQLRHPGRYLLDRAALLDQVVHQAVCLGSSSRALLGQEAELGRGLDVQAKFLEQRRPFLQVRRIPDRHPGSAPLYDTPSPQIPVVLEPERFRVSNRLQVCNGRGIVVCWVGVHAVGELRRASGRTRVNVPCPLEGLLVDPWVQVRPVIGFAGLEDAP